MSETRADPDKISIKEETETARGLQPAEATIDPENEVTGIKLLLIHTGICLCTFLIGLVSFALWKRNPKTLRLTLN